MTDLDDQFARALKVHQSGDLFSAKSLYENILNQHPNHADTLHLLGLLAAQLGEFEVSMDWIQKAIALKPDVPVFHNNFGNSLKALGKLDEAVNQYRIALNLQDDYAEAHNNLGSALYKQNNFDEAFQHYAEAVRLQPDYVEAHVNLGLLFLRQNNIDAAIKQFSNVVSLQPDFVQAHWQLGNLHLARKETDIAITHYQAVLQYQPDHVDTLNNLGVAYLKQGKFKDALELFQKALTVDPKHQDARSNLAATFLQQDRFTESAWHYQLYLQLAPDDIDAHYNYAVAAMALGNLEDAIQHFQRTVELMPDHADAHGNLAAIYVKMGKKDQAIDHYQKILAIQPENAAAIYMLGALTKSKVLPAAPAQYIKNLFDNYAGYFDTQLVDSLHYKIPTLMRTVLGKFVAMRTTHERVLDLGCGTGLSGEAFRDLAKYLVGVDLSSRMLEKAKEKTIYDELHEMSILDFLATAAPFYDLILAADTLVYFGDLSPIFAGCYRILSAKGLFIFSTEIGTAKIYELQATGRYVHSKAYVDQLAAEQGFIVLGFQEVIGRYQQDKPVKNFIYLLQK